LYDVFTDNIILKNLTKDGFVALIQLDKNKVESFSIEDHYFAKYKRDNERTSGYQFYDVLYDSGGLKLISKRLKKTKIESVSEMSYEQDDEFYLVEDNHWVAIKGKKDFYKTLSSQDSKVKLGYFIKQRGIKLRKKRDEDLRTVTAFIISLKH
jgi:hypothetical protein